MSLSTAIVAALDARPDHPGPSPQTVSAQEGPCRLTLEMTACGPAGVEFRRLTFSVAEPDQADWAIDALKSWGDRLTARLTYLMEPLAVLEADADSGEVILRSQSPTPRADRRSFYEVRLDRSGTLQLQRFAFDNDTRRRQAIPCQLSREVLDRLADDLVVTARPA
ncbi:hypothetical protein BH23PLA1_BH23PLA1_29360 [soil metagenome]